MEAFQFVSVIDKKSVGKKQKPEQNVSFSIRLCYWQKKCRLKTKTRTKTRFSDFLCFNIEFKYLESICRFVLLKIWILGCASIHLHTELEQVFKNDVCLVCFDQRLSWWQMVKAGIDCLHQSSAQTNHLANICKLQVGQYILLSYCFACNLNLRHQYHQVYILINSGWSTILISEE